MAGVDQLAVVARQRLEPVVGRLDEDVRLVARAAQDALDAEHLVADGVAVAERREHLVDAADHPCARRPAAPRAFRQRGPPSGRALSAAPARTSPARRATSRARRPESAAAAARQRHALRLLRQPLEHVEILAARYRPVVVVAKELAAVLPERPASQRLLLDRSSVSTNSAERLVVAARRCCGGTAP